MKVFVKKIVLLKKSGKYDDITKSYLEKQTRYAARFALILHGIWNLKVRLLTSFDVTNAIKLCRYFISCFTVITQNKLDYDEAEEYALNFIKRKKLKSISPTYLHKNNKTIFKNTNPAKLALEGLAIKGYGRIQKAKNGETFIYYE